LAAKEKEILLTWATKRWRKHKFIWSMTLPMAPGVVVGEALFDKKYTLDLFWNHLS
jgi:hypothetical protein